jgi:hypothetical protein
MRYDLRIRREGREISLEEWRAVVRGNTELRLDATRGPGGRALARGLVDWDARSVH